MSTFRSSECEAHGTGPAPGTAAESPPAAKKKRSQWKGPPSWAEPCAAWAPWKPQTLSLRMPVRGGKPQRREGTLRERAASCCAKPSRVTRCQSLGGPASRQNCSTLNRSVFRKLCVSTLHIRYPETGLSEVVGVGFLS
eukprot:2745355-Rhodomonas_salina.1